MKLEGGAYTPPQAVQYSIRAVRVAQASAAILYFFGSQIFGAVKRPPPGFVEAMHANPLLAIGGVYGLDVVAQTMKSINAFEITYNGHVLHSKLKTGRFPQPAELVKALNDIRASEKPARRVAADTVTDNLDANLPNLDAARPTMT